MEKRTVPLIKHPAMIAVSKRMLRFLSLFCICFGLLLAGCSGAGAERTKIIRIGYIKDSTLNLVKANQNLTKRLKKAKTVIQWIQYPDDSAIFAAMNKGRVDFAAVGDAVPVFQHADKPKIDYLAAEPPNPNAQGIFVRKNSPIHSLKDLRKKKIGYERFSNQHFFLAQMLKTAHLSLTDIHSVYITPEQGLYQLKSGSIDALAVGEPYQSKALSSGFMKLAAQSSFQSNRDVYVVNDSIYRKDKTAVDRIMAAIQQADGTIQTNPHTAAALLKEKTDVSHLQWLSVFDDKLFGTSSFFPGMVREQQQRVDDLVSLKLIKKRYNIGNYILSSARQQ
ncbi:ABC transporter substrate-binding protein [Sporolactobacillus sp. CQH2019]|uniref:ABC transporter substrate-binding protein n=1 Tax=Sporolactobacillus sp. CQH2019 TaxID=3023512 RepID=UPI00236742E9|nr:ABC transporter substrate-binding protein [Sporolactobacillus sp. CQH2019]MDD9147419.1 ABC transporter substrate-binding protein [Sporolactobacillus sp. CQH2019]